MSDLKKLYNEEIVPKLREEFGYKNIMEVPKITKITLNMGVGEAAADRKAIEGALSDMTAIAGQKPVVTKARKSVAGFKIREGWPIGCKVTLRNRRMYEFLERLVSVAIPRVRDFRGLKPKSFDEVQAEVRSLKVEKVAWRKIAWKTCLLDGLKASREQKKPLMLWIFIDRPIDDERC